MSITVSEKKLTKRRALPDFSFPPTCSNRSAPTKSSPDSNSSYNDKSSTEEQSLKSTQTTSSISTPQQRTKPDFACFGFPAHKPSTPKSTPKPTMPPPNNNPLNSPLLSLPLEIRLKIYYYVIATHPAKHVHLSPSYLYPLSLFPPQGRSEPMALANLNSTPSPSPVFAKKIGYIPSTLLRSCRQIYHESRDLPFESCEFTFVNWFCSGVFAARSFLNSLRDWQTERIRWVGLEALGRDLVGVGVGCGLRGKEKVRAEWEDVCEILHGIWGFRLVVKGRVGGEVVTEKREIDTDIVHDVDDDKPGAQWIEAVHETQIVQVVKNEVLSIENTWVREGLAKMTSLKWLEICIEDDQCPLPQKEAFCAQLREYLGVKVMLVPTHADEVHEGDTPDEVPS